MQGLIPKTTDLCHVCCWYQKWLKNQFTFKLKTIKVEKKSGFRTNLSTNVFLAQLTDFALTGTDRQINTGMILIGIQKAFDTLENEVLLEKNEIFWFPNICSWVLCLKQKMFGLYWQLFLFWGWNIKYRVPQGSILGPFLFLLYVNDLPQSLSEAGSYMYADDACVFYQHEVAKKIKKFLDKEFLSLFRWSRQ